MSEEAQTQRSLRVLNAKVISDRSRGFAGPVMTPNSGHISVTVALPGTRATGLVETNHATSEGILDCVQPLSRLDPGFRGIATGPLPNLMNDIHVQFAAHLHVVLEARRIHVCTIGPRSARRVRTSHRGMSGRADSGTYVAGV